MPNRQVNPHDRGQLKVPGQASHSGGYFLNGWRRAGAHGGGRPDKVCLGGEKDRVGIQDRPIFQQALVTSRID